QSLIDEIAQVGRRQKILLLRPHKPVGFAAYAVHQSRSQSYMLRQRFIQKKKLLLQLFGVDGRSSTDLSQIGEGVFNHVLRLVMIGDDQRSQSGVAQARSVGRSLSLIVDKVRVVVVAQIGGMFVSEQIDIEQSNHREILLLRNEVVVNDVGADAAF